jgi:gliding-associated putative ABC transporter substrate-binding component GldG
MRSKLRKTQSVVRSLLVIAIVVVVNVIAVRVFGRIDLTAQHVFTLSDASKNLVQSLDDRVTVRAYFTEDLPVPHNEKRRAVLDMLNEYKAYSGGMFQFDFINPQGEQGEQEAQQQGILPIQAQVIKNDKLEVMRGYLGLVLHFEDRKEVLPVVQNLANLEYDISGALKRLINVAKKKIGYSTGHQESGPDQWNQVAHVLREQYELVPVDLTTPDPVPSDLEVLLVIAAKTVMSDSATMKLDRYVMRGGRLGVFINAMNANLQARYAQPAEPVLRGLLETYGIRVNTDVVRDAQCATISVRQQQGPFMFNSQIPFPYLPMASKFNEDNMMVKDLGSVVFFFVSSIDTSGSSAKRVKAQVLVRSSSQSARQSGFTMIDPFQEYSDSDFPESDIPLAVLLEGSFQSHSAMPGSDLVSPETRIVVVGDGDFMSDEYMGNAGNLTFFANIVDYLADDAGLITIRSKNLQTPPLSPVSAGIKPIVKYGNLVLPPLLVIVYGLFRWRRRLARKKALVVRPTS